MKWKNIFSSSVYILITALKTNNQIKLILILKPQYCSSILDNIEAIDYSNFIIGCMAR